mmetsp:Transcript_34997/g.56706  ORF Transcript_34997/g.56706 Transcript_34997/m.56706 type:complete len:216 (-) Transcript_34997:41-688(-)
MFRLPSRSLSCTVPTIRGKIIDPVRAVTEGIMGARMTSAQMKQYARANVFPSPASDAILLASLEARFDFISARAMKNAITTSHKFFVPKSFKAACMLRQPLPQATATAMMQRGPKPNPPGRTTAPTIVAMNIASNPHPAVGTDSGAGKAKMTLATPSTTTHGHPSLDLRQRFHADCCSSCCSGWWLSLPPLPLSFIKRALSSLSSFWSGYERYFF